MSARTGRSSLTIARTSSGVGFQSKRLSMTAPSRESNHSLCRQSVRISVASVSVQSVIAIAEAVRSRERTAVEVLEECLARLDADNPALNAFVVVDEGLARKAAEAVDAAVARGEDPGPMAGVPFGVKDLEDCAGLPTSHGSLLYKDRPPMGEG